MVAIGWLSIVVTILVIAVMVLFEKVIALKSDLTLMGDTLEMDKKGKIDLSKVKNMINTVESRMLETVIKKHSEVTQRIAEIPEHIVSSQLKLNKAELDSVVSNMTDTIKNFCKAYNDAVLAEVDTKLQVFKESILHQMPSVDDLECITARHEDTLSRIDDNFNSVIADYNEVKYVLDKLKKALNELN